MPIKGIILFAFFIGSLPVCFFRPFYGILLWTVVAFLNPQSELFYWSAATSFPWAVAVAVPTLAGLVISSPRWSNLNSSKFALIGLLWIWFTISSLISTHTAIFIHHAADTWFLWRFVSKILLMTVVMIVVVDSLQRFRIFVMVMAGCFAVFIVKALPFLVVTGGSFRLYGPDYSMIADNNDFGLALNMTLPMFFFLAQSEERRWVRLMCWGLFIATIPSIFFTYSRGALVGLIAILLAMLVRSRHRFLLLPVIGFGIAIALLFAPAAWRHRMDPTRPDAIDGSAKSRLNAWSYSWNLAQDYPVAGGGFGTFTPRLFDIYAPDARDLHGPHSIYFEILAEHGFVGLALYLTLIFSCFASIFRIVRQAKHYGDQTVLAYANMFRFSLIGFLSSGIFLGRAYFDYFFAIVAALAVLEKTSGEEWAAIEDEEEEGRELLALVPENGVAS